MADNTIQVDIIGKIDPKTFNKARKDAETILQGTGGDKTVKLKLDTSELSKIKELSTISKSFDTKVKLDQTDIINAQNKIIELKSAISSIKGQIKLTADGGTRQGLEQTLIGLKENLTQSQREFKNLTATGDTSISRLQSKFGALGGAIGDLGSRIKSYSTFLVSTAIIGGTTSLIKSVFELTSKNQLLEQSFTALTGSAEKSAMVMQQLTDIALKTPFNRLEIAEATKRMLAFGFSTEQALAQVQVISDTTSALGGTQDDFNGISRAFGQIASKNRLFQEELNQLTERGVPAVTILKDKLGLTVDELKNIGNVGIDANTAIGALLEGLNEKFAGSAERATKTLSGRLSNVKDLFEKVVIDFGNSINPILESLVGSIENFVKNKLPGILEGTAIILNDIKIAIEPLIPLFTYVAGAVGGVVKWFAELSKEAPKLVQFIGALGISFLTFGGVIRTVVTGIISLLGTLGIIGTTVTALSGPIGLIIALLTSLGISYFATQTNLLGFQDTLKITSPIIDEYNKKLDDNKTKLDALTELYNNGKISLEEYAKSKALLSIESDKLQKKIDEEKNKFQDIIDIIEKNKKQIGNLSDKYNDNIGIIERLKNGNLTLKDRLILATKGITSTAGAINLYTDNAKDNLLAIENLTNENINLEESLRSQGVEFGNIDESVQNSSIQYAVLNGQLIDLKDNSDIAKIATQQLNNTVINFDQQVKEVARLSQQFGYLSQQALTAQALVNQSTKSSLEKITNPLGGLGNLKTNLDFTYFTNKESAQKEANAQLAKIQANNIKSLFPPGGTGGGGSKSKKSAEETAKDEAKKLYDIKKDQLDKELELEIEQANKLGRTAEEKEKLIASIKKEYEGKDLQLKKQILGETLGLTEYEVEKQKEYQKELADYNDGLFEKAKTNLEKVDEKIKTSGDLIIDYGKKASEAGEGFNKLKEEALDSLEDINYELSELGKTKGDDLATRLIEAKKELSDIQLETEKTAEDLQKINDLQSEINFINGNTTEQERLKAEEISKQSEAQKILNKFKEDEVKLLEKKAIQEAIGRGDFTRGTVDEKTGKVDLTDSIQFRKNEITGLYEYIDVTGKAIEIKDRENQQLVEEYIQKATEYVTDYTNYKAKLDNEVQALRNANEERLQLEQKYTNDIGGLLKTRSKDLEDYQKVLYDTGTSIRTLMQDLEGTGIPITSILQSSLSGVVNSNLPGNQSTTNSSTINNQTSNSTVNVNINGLTTSSNPEVANAAQNLVRLLKIDQKQGK